jgi:hypothetical protein
MDRLLHHGQVVPIEGDSYRHPPPSRRGVGQANDRASPPARPRGANQRLRVTAARHPSPPVQEGQRSVWPPREAPGRIARSRRARVDQPRPGGGAGVVLRRRLDDRISLAAPTVVRTGAP